MSGGKTQSGTQASALDAVWEVHICSPLRLLKHFRSKVFPVMRSFSTNELPVEVENAIYDISTRMENDGARVSPDQDPTLLMLPEAVEQAPHLTNLPYIVPRCASSLRAIAHSMLSQSVRLHSMPPSQICDSTSTLSSQACGVCVVDGTTWNGEVVVLCAGGLASAHHRPTCSDA